MRTEKKVFCLCHFEVYATKNPMDQRALVVWMLTAFNGKPTNQGSKL